MKVDLADELELLETARAVHWLGAVFMRSVVVVFIVAGVDIDVEVILVKGTIPRLVVDRQRVTECCL